MTRGTVPSRMLCVNASYCSSFRARAFTTWALHSEDWRFTVSPCLLTGGLVGIPWVPNLRSPSTNVKGLSSEKFIFASVRLLFSVTRPLDGWLLQCIEVRTRPFTSFVAWHVFRTEFSDRLNLQDCAVPQIRRWAKGLVLHFLFPFRQWYMYKDTCT